MPRAYWPNSRVLEAIFSDLVLVKREASEPIEVDPNHAVVVRVTEHQSSEPRPLADVADEIRERLLRESAREAARAQAAALVEQFEEGGQTLEEVAEAESLELQQQKATRRSFDLSGAVLDTIFRLPAPADGGAVHEAGCIGLELACRAA